MSEPTRDNEDLLVQAAEFMRDRYFGKYRGLVRDVDDTEGLGRIVVQVPEVYGDADSPWALPCVPFAGSGHGWVCLPEVGDGVWIEFEAGDPSRPIWVGCWWAADEMPDPAAAQVRVWATTGGHKIILDDDNNELKVLHASGAELTMTSSDITLKKGSQQVVISASSVSVNNGALEVR